MSTEQPTTTEPKQSSTILDDQRQVIADLTGELSYWQDSARTNAQLADKADCRCRFARSEADGLLAAWDRDQLSATLWGAAMALSIVALLLAVILRHDEASHD